MIAVLAFGAGIVIATGPGRAERRLVSSYVTAWEHGDYRHMYSLLDKTSRRRMSEPQFVAAYKTAAGIATLLSVVPSHVGNRVADAIPVRMWARTRLFGTLPETLNVPLDGSGSGATIRFSEMLLFPGLRDGEKLARRTSLAAARDPARQRRHAAGAGPR